MGNVYFDDQQTNFIHQRGHLILVPVAVRDHHYQVYMLGDFWLQDVEEALLHELGRVCDVPTVHYPDRLSPQYFWTRLNVDNFL